MTEEYLSLMGPEWRKEYEDAKSAIGDLTQLVVKFNNESRKGELKLLDAKSISQALKASDELARSQKSMNDAADAAMAKHVEVQRKEAEAHRKFSENAAKQRLEELRLQKQREQAFDKYEKGIQRQDALRQKAADKAKQDAERESAAIKKLGNDYELLKLAYKDAADKAKNFGVTLGLNSPQFKAAAADAKKMYEILAAVETSVGQNQRNVGNYKSGRNQQLDLAVQRILQEAPSAVNSIDTFFLAISNNLPDLFDQIGKVNKGLVELKATAAAANLELEAQTTIQKAAQGTAKEAEETLSAQVEGIIASVGASKEQAAALRESITAEVQSAGATAENSAITAANTEAIAINAGATAEDAAALRVQTEATVIATAAAARQTAALEAQTIATAEATAAVAAAPTAIKGVIRSLFSVNAILTAGVLLLTLFGGKVIDFLTGTTEATKEAEKAAKKYAESLKSIQDGEIKAAAAEVAHMETLISVATNVNRVMADRKAAVLELQKTYPARFANLSQEAILEGKVADAIERTRNEIYARARADAANKKFGEAESEIYELTRKLNETGKQYDALKKKLETPLSYSGAIAFRMRRELSSLGKDYQSTADEISKLQIQQSQFRDDADKAAADTYHAGEPPEGTTAALRKKITDLKAVIELQKIGSAEQAASTKQLIVLEKQLQEVEGKGPKAPKGPKAVDFTKTIVDTEQKTAEKLAEVKQQELQLSMELNRSIYEDQRLSFSDRLLAANAYTIERKQQLEAERDGELQANKAMLDKIASIEKKSSLLRSNTDRKLLLEKSGYVAETKLITAKFNAGTEKSERESLERVNAISDSEYQKRKAIIAKHLAELSEQNDQHLTEELAAAAERYSRGGQSEVTYHAETARIRNTYHAKELQDQLNLIAGEITQRKIYLQDATDLEKEAAEIRKKINDDVSKANIAALEMEAEARKELYGQIAQLGREIANAGVAFLDAGFQRRIEQLDKEKQAINDNLELELASIEANTLAGVDREEKIADAKQQAAAKEREIDAQREEAENRRKEIAKAAQAASIAAQAIQTGMLLSAKAAEATAQALFYGGLSLAPGGQIYIPAEIASFSAAATISAQIPVIAGLAAAQIAALYAYKDGTLDHPVDSWALVGDGYRQEVVQTPDGDAYLTPAVPTMAYLDKHTKVFSSVDEYMKTRFIPMQMSQHIPEMVQTINVDQSGVRADLQALTEQMAALTKVVKAQKPVVLESYDSRFAAHYNHRIKRS